MSDLTIDVSQLKTLARDLRRADPLLAKNFLKGIGRAGDVVAFVAKQNASAFPGTHRTDRIARSIKVRRRGVSVRVLAGGDAAPEAAPIEHGGKPGTFRHPVFGHRDMPWASQAAHPFLTPAVEATMVPFEAEILSQVDRTFHEAGFRG